ncbi:sugar phosphate isomerase/epimerase family protein [Castellaniella sp.]|uniref:sugar phosphate isomerase/epimerase family protein n=1 Tax=Castellaniella sp. TaxID=1955812 RepID=UPI002AFFF7C1|nr:sugar phosphate isomerase/epimerase family protein [Castellaniella sp.]
MADNYLADYAESGLYMMQGRLTTPENGRFQSFPRKQWRKEILSAASVGLRGIEWIYDAYGEGENPLETPAGREELKTLLAENHVSVVSICADYFMDYPFLRCTEAERAARLERLSWLIGICPELGVKRIVLPFVDASSIRSSVEQDQVVACLEQILPVAVQDNVELHLETDLAPAAFRDLLRQINHPVVKVNYDSGNSSSLGYAPEVEFDAYGPWVGSVHIKDRVLGGKTVPLGQGDADFTALREALVKASYRGDIVLQVARGAPGDELNWMREVVAAASAWLRGGSL